MSFIELHNVSKSWPDMSINIDLQLEKGECLAIAGPSGCGKSTTLRMITGLEKCDSGSIFIDNKDISKLEPKDRGIGMVFQDYSLFPHLDVEGNIEYGLKSIKMKKNLRKEKVKTLLKMVDLEGFEKRKILDLSGGEKQRVALARSLALEPKIILFDEPLSSLDSSLRKHLRTELAQQQKKLGITSIFVTHDMEEAMEMGDKIAIMKNGKILQNDFPLQLWKHPKTKIVSKFLGNGPTLLIKEIEKESNGSLFANTDFGKIIISDEAFTRYNEIIGNKKNAYVFFDRNVHLSKSNKNSLKVFCNTVTFIGDSYECVCIKNNNKIVLHVDSSTKIENGDTIDIVYSFIDIIPEN